MKLQEQYVRYSTTKSEEKLSKRFGLYWDIKMQDWDLEVSDYGRIDDFLKIYQVELDNDNDKFSLMALIVSSFDGGILNNEDIKPNWDICKTILEKECYLHYSTIVYWCQFEKENVFDVTPLMREVWQNVKIRFQ